MTDEQKARLATKRPLTKEEYEARQSVIRRVVDPETGRTRLMRGEGEIIEEIVTRDRHKEINKVSRRSSVYVKNTLLLLAGWQTSLRSLSDWLCVRSGLLWTLPFGELGAGWEEMVRSRWFLFLRKSLFAPRPKLPLRRTMRAVLDLAGRERWWYSSWDKWAAYPSVMNCGEDQRRGKFHLKRKVI
ncbi:hypothetical protein GOODEAATRI_002740 [Goodea atripinnis]|uniref:ADP-ribosylation factor-like protein 6-interacting protein 4 n=1 Tax=Goodea atripinnis TaxID=208336 RepID=A0ABV0P0X8_9TELE